MARQGEEQKRAGESKNSSNSCTLRVVPRRNSQGERERCGEAAGGIKLYQQGEVKGVGEGRIRKVGEKVETNVLLCRCRTEQVREMITCCLEKVQLWREEPVNGPEKGRKLIMKIGEE